MGSLATTSLSAAERELLERFASLLNARLGDALSAVWLYGSRARGEPASHPDSDVDVLVIVADASWDGRQRVFDALRDAAAQTGHDAAQWSFSVHVHDPAWLEDRRTIRSFFIAEVDRDKVVLRGSE